MKDRTDLFPTIRVISDVVQRDRLYGLLRSSSFAEGRELVLRQALSSRKAEAAQELRVLTHLSDQTRVEALRAIAAAASVEHVNGALRAAGRQ